MRKLAQVQAHSDGHRFVVPTVVPRRPFCPECDLGVNACTCELEPVNFRCAIEKGCTPGPRCEQECVSCKTWREEQEADERLWREQEDADAFES